MCAKSYKYNKFPIKKGGLRPPIYIVDIWPIAAIYASNLYSFGGSDSELESREDCVRLERENRRHFS